MANQKITDLNKLHKLTSSDLLIVVDTDSKSLSTSPTGETMAIEAGRLADELAEIQQGNVGISFDALSDVPDNYTDYPGGYVKISELVNPVTGKHEIEFTDSPGASEMAVVFAGNFYITDADPNAEVGAVAVTETDYHVGDVMRRDIELGVYKHASSANSDEAEAIGIIRNIRKNPSGPGNLINIVFGGHVVFSEFPRIRTETSDNNQPPVETALIDGKTYFLCKDGTLASFDPSESLKEEGTFAQVSKPLLVATGQSSGVMVNYRGLVCEKSEEPHKFIVEHEASCSNIKVGDVVRVKRRIQRFADDIFGQTATGGTGGKVNEFKGEYETLKPQFLDTVSGSSDYVLSNSASLAKNPEVDFDDSYGCDILGIVIEAASEFFQVQTTGMITFPLPTGMTDDPTNKNRATRPDAMFKRGYTYYLEAFDITPDENTETNLKVRLRNPIYDYTTSEIDDYFNGVPAADLDMEDVLTGISPFRNTTIQNPFTRDPKTGRVMAYAKPVFYAVSERQILLLNETAYPPPFDQCNAVNPTTQSSCFELGREEKNFTTAESPDTNASDFLNSAWATAGELDVAIITHIPASAGEPYITAKWLKAADNINKTDGTIVFGSWSKTSTTST